MKDDSNNKPQNATLTQVFQSVLAALFGVQSDKNRRRDFNAANPKTYLIVGVIVTLLFILTVVTVVNIVVS